MHHVVSSIIAPFGEPIEARPAVPTEEERVAEREEKLRLKNVRRGKIPPGVPDVKIEDKVDEVDVKTADELLSGVQEAREEVGDVKGVQL